MSYDKMWRARECAWASVHGTLEDSYAKLPLWTTVLESTNPGLITNIYMDSDNKFEYYFMNIGAFVQHMHPVVTVDVALQI